MVIVVVGVLSEVPVTVGVPEAIPLSDRVGSQSLARVLTKFDVLGIAHVVEVGSLMNKSSCRGIATDRLESPEFRAEVDPIPSSVS